MSHSMSALPEKLPACGAGAAAAAGAGAGAFSAAFGVSLAGAASPDVSTSAMTVPCETLSPALIRISLTMPAVSLGTSMDALSDSSVSSDCSFSIASPGLILTSMTSTSLKSPISGTFTSTRLIVSPSLVDGDEKNQPQGQKTGSAPNRITLCSPPKDAPFFCLLFFGRQRKVGAAPHRGSANRPLRKQVLQRDTDHRKKPAPRATPHQRITRRKSARIAPRYALKRAASAPSITRWS